MSLPVRGAWIEILRMAGDVEYVKSLPVRGAWIEMALVRIADFYGVSSLPVRGAWIEIKSTSSSISSARSLPVRGAWIEMEESRSGAPGLCRRSPCGERGLKSLDDIEVYKWRGRSPCGERGLKSKLSPS